MGILQLSFIRRVNLPGVRFIGVEAFDDCTQLTDVEFGKKLETIGRAAFWNCNSLRHLHIPSIRSIEENAFCNCTSLTDVEFGQGLETIEGDAFNGCPSLRRIAIPLKDNMFPFDVNYESYSQFDGCEELATVDLVGGIHKTISYLSLQSWRNEMNQEINHINQILPTTHTLEKAGLIRYWIQSVLRQTDHFKAKHHNLLKVATTILELALWKANLAREDGGDALVETKAKKAKIDSETERKERRITCGADIIIKNAMPFLELPIN